MNKGAAVGIVRLGGRGALDAAAEGDNADRAVAAGGRVPAGGKEPRSAVGSDTSLPQGAWGMGRTPSDAVRQRLPCSGKVPAEPCDERAAAAWQTAMNDTVVSKRDPEQASDGAGPVSTEESELGVLVGAAAPPRAGAAGDKRATSDATRRRQRRSAMVPMEHRDKRAAHAAGVLATAGEDKADRPLDNAGFAAAQGGERAAPRRGDASPRAGARGAGGARGVELIAGHSTRLRQLRFAKVLAETCNVALAAASAGRTVATVHRWRSVDAAFAAAWDEALAVGYDRLENALLVYALGKIDSAACGAAGNSISNGDLQLAVGMLQRHRAAVSDRRGQALPVKMPTEAETDAALKRALDGLARRGKAS